MNRDRRFNCPNCGAPIRSFSFRCDYCGTEYDWIPVMRVEHLPANVKTLRAGANVSDDVMRHCSTKSVQNYVGDQIIEAMKPKLKEILSIKQERNPDLCMTQFRADLRVILPMEENTK